MYNTLTNENYDISTLVYTDLDAKTCTGTVSVTPITAGELTITRCASGTAAGATATVGATVKNTGNMNNNSFVILISVARADTGATIISGSSGNLPPLAPQQISAEYTLSFTMPEVNINAAFRTQADPGNNY